MREKRGKERLGRREGERTFRETIVRERSGRREKENVERDERERSFREMRERERSGTRDGERTLREKRGRERCSREGNLASGPCAFRQNCGLSHCLVQDPRREPHTEWPGLRASSIERNSVNFAFSREDLAQDTFRHCLLRREILLLWR